MATIAGTAKMMEVSMRLVRDKALGTTLEYAMTNSFGFGGTNASLIFRAPTH
jgi:3-oxoacyl-(acyl-carrier-protein) synthase